MGLLWVTWWRMGKSGRVNWPSETELEAGPASLRVVLDADTGSEEEEEENLRRRGGLRMVEVLGFRNLKEGNFKAIPSIYDCLLVAADITEMAKNIQRRWELPFERLFLPCGPSSNVGSGPVWTLDRYSYPVSRDMLKLRRKSIEFAVYKLFFFVGFMSL